ncbi:MAG: tRNA (adenosine(37)-N6)-threonylcarbamoyltransferase complex dimerization subunit type 1 TsaB [Anaerolineae bacterium]
MLLAIDTATHRASIALHDGAVLRAECTWESVNRHTVTLLPRIVELLASSDLSATDLTAIGICIGPGSYTGVRIGVSVAKGLASARKLPMVGVSTLDILAEAQPQSLHPMYAILAAGRKRLGYARYRWREDGWQAETGVQIVDWRQFTESLELPAVVVGEIGSVGKEALRPLFGRVEIPSPAQHLRRAGYLADIAWRRLRANQVDAPSALLPLYAR